MQSLRVHPQGRLVVEETIEPEVPRDGVLVEVAYGGICGSDLHYAAQGRNGDFVVTEPLTLGHEISGTVVGVGREAHDAPAVGTRVVVHPATPCPPAGAVESLGENRSHGGSYLGSASTTPHTQGGFAAVVPARVGQLRPIPRGLSLRTAALAEPMAVALHGVALAGDLGGRSVLVSGAGPIGLLAIIAARAGGAGRIVATDLSERALRIAASVGADDGRNLSRGHAPAPSAADVVIEASGAPAAVAAALRAAAPGGTVVQLGMVPSGDIALPYSEILAKEIRILGSWRFDIELDRAIEILADHPEAENVISHEFAIADGVEAFSAAADASMSSKVLLRIA